MVTASVRFLTNNLVADLACKSADLQRSLEEIGVLTPLSILKLDNARTLQVHLRADDEVGQLICNIVNPKSDTLGNVQRLCRHIHCLNEQNRNTLISKLESGEIRSVQKGIKFAEKLREENKTR